MKRFLAALCSYLIAFSPVMARDINVPRSDEDINFYSKPGGTPTMSLKIKGSTGKPQMDEIEELTPDAGVTIDGTLIKDGNWSGTVTGAVYTTGNQSIGGTKTFTSTISGSIDGNAATVTNGVYTTGDQSIGGTKSFTLGISAPTLDTGQGANELYDMNQNVQTTDTVTFGTVNISKTSSGWISNISQDGTTNDSHVMYVYGANTTNARILQVNSGAGIILRADGNRRIGFGADPVYNSADSSLVQIRNNDDPSVCMVDTDDGGQQAYRISSDSGNFIIQKTNNNCENTGTLFSMNSSGVITANGSGFTSLNATNLASGTVAEARLPYRMNQDVRSTDAVSFASINTGPGATEVHLMNQNLQTSDAPAFNSITINGGTETIARITNNGGTPWNSRLIFNNAGTDVNHISSYGSIGVLRHYAHTGYRQEWYTNGTLGATLSTGHDLTVDGSAYAANLGQDHVTTSITTNIPNKAVDLMHYSRVGKMLSVEISMEINANNGDNGTAYVGLPYSVKAGRYGTCSAITNTGGVHSAWISVPSNGTNINFDFPSYRRPLAVIDFGNSGHIQYFHCSALIPML